MILRYEERINLFSLRLKMNGPILITEKEETCNLNSLSLSLSPVAPTLEHRASVKRFVSLQFLNPKTDGRTP
jgi:hypothetical protein